MFEFGGRVAAITGAAKGIGRALACELASRGCDIAVSDVDESNLRETAAMVRERGAAVQTSVVDVSEREAVHDWADGVVDRFGDVHLVVNNAGVSLTGTVEDLSYEDFEWLMSINFWGVVYGTKAFLPHIREAGVGRVVNISSAFGLIASATQSAYNAAKFAVRGFTESLRAELALEGSEVAATCVHPGGVDTTIVRNSRIGNTGAMDRDPEELIEEFEEQIARTSPEEAARTIADGIERGRERILVGADAKLVDALQRLAPETYVDVVAKFIRFQGR